MLGEELQPRLLRTPSSWWFSWVSFYRESRALPHHLHVTDMPQGLVPALSGQPWGLMHVSPLTAALARTGASQGFPRAAAPVGVFSREIGRAHV